ncbi:site-specific DNA-methyltransferase [Thermocrinis sp.]|jgi:site-specific DNA-methyltransferase (adenine-specific)|uniref:DNA-methyltransferase n=1 Tax=Thermocrinis sp. TaxID=2024383 RepID=UPI0026268C2D|nr:site-specific DNA-methyltransferase [Thermocrinis sp.]
MARRISTKTSEFGSRGRIAHDSSLFYKRKIYKDFFNEPVQYVENNLPKELLNKIFCKSSENMSELPDNSVHLMITSPPYNVGKEYDQDMSLEEYREFLRRVWKEVYRVLVPGGRACINIANIGRKPYIPLHAFIIEDMLNLGFLMRGEIIWVKKGGGAPSTAWGTWMSAKNPTLRDEHEYILVFSKKFFERPKTENKEDTITREEFLEFTRSVWYMKPETAKKIGHPAPFPVELPYRLIQLYSFKGDVVLDPFMGSGQTALACLKTGRFYIGYEINEDYVRLAEKRIREWLANGT